MPTNKSIFAALSALLVTSEAAAQVLPLPIVDNDYHEFTEDTKAKVELGRMLFFDKILSGNRNVSCASCHHPFTGTSDGLGVSVGEGGRGLSVVRTTGEGKEAITERVPRNSPALSTWRRRSPRSFFTMAG